jgi:hypothetical protein
VILLPLLPKYWNYSVFHHAWLISSWFTNFDL